MTKKQKQPREILMPMDGTEEQEVSTHDHNPRTDPAMRDGNSSHGNPSETAIDEPTSDNDVGDAEGHAPPQKPKSRRGRAIGRK
jgi:hypothetical protein